MRCTKHRSHPRNHQQRHQKKTRSGKSEYYLVNRVRYTTTPSSSSKARDSRSDRTRCSIYPTLDVEEKRVRYPLWIASFISMWESIPCFVFASKMIPLAVFPEILITPCLFGILITWLLFHRIEFCPTYCRAWFKTWSDTIRRDGVMQFVVLDQQYDFALSLLGLKRSWYLPSSRAGTE
jgi:hypothetical protein